jgi:hypothetical protein
MNQFLNGVARAVAETFDLPGPILEVGSYQVPGQAEIADLRALFAGKPYTASTPGLVQAWMKSPTWRGCPMPTPRSAP